MQAPGRQSSFASPSVPERSQVCGLKSAYRALSHRAPGLRPTFRCRIRSLKQQCRSSSSTDQMVVLEELSELERTDLAADAVVWASQHGLVRS